MNSGFIYLKEIEHEFNEAGTVLDITTEQFDDYLASAKPLMITMKASIGMEYLTLSAIMLPNNFTGEHVYYGQSYPFELSIKKVGSQVIFQADVPQ